MEVEEINLENPEIKNILANYYEKVVPNLLEYGAAINANLSEELDEFDAEFIILITINGVVAVLSAIWGLVLLFKVEDLKERVLFLFLEIPVANVEAISKRRDKFMEYFDNLSRIDQN
mmetsp:Transcript_5269/g.4463  ORF Transcript_5269/g.4463 Transcript_5269/m.4463 type:complete len:118 (+) Transcript_5269:1120-1473(+)